MAQGISLHIGVNEVDPDHYAGWSGPLMACEADAREYQTIAAARNFESRTLLTEGATREAVITAVTGVADRLQTGDMFLLTYSGHGGQVPDTSGDEVDGFDETWCLFDGQLIDDELFTLWTRFQPGVRILLILDSCHSGTAIRAPQLIDRESVTRGPVAAELGIVGAAYRSMPRRESLRTYRQHREFYNRLQARVSPPEDLRATVRSLSACQDNQFALDGLRNGLFTGTLLVVWDDGLFQGNYGSFHQQILELMPLNQSPNHLVIGPPNPSYDGDTPFSL
jgi:metacaspase-1